MKISADTLPTSGWIQLGNMEDVREAASVAGRGVFVLGQSRHFTNSNGPTFVSESEAAKLRVVGELLNEHGAGDGNAADDDGATLHESDPLVDCRLLSLRVHHGHQPCNFHLLRHGVAVHDSFVSRSEDGLVLQEVQHYQLGLKQPHATPRVLSVADDEASGDIFFIHSGDTQADVLPGPCIGHLIVISVHVLNLDRHAIGHQHQVVAALHCACFCLAHDNDAEVLVLVQDGHAEGCVLVAVLRLQCV
mmetsp:Transcript_27221/g.37546  ORF Transcript_27221/g.37546 Transcript_27221/m.37546 type:complete len:248 (-) Transcript_27221:1307-2050(-)